MKKMMSVILLVAMISSLFCTVAFAAGSTEALVEVVNAKNANVVAVDESKWVDVVEIAKAIEELDEDGIKAFEEAGFKASTVALTVISQNEIKVEAGKTATMTIDANGDATISAAVFLKNAESEYKLLGVGELPMEVETEESGELIVALIR